MQTEKCWMFRVNNKFSLSNKNIVHIVKPEEHAENTQIIKKKKLAKFGEMCKLVIHRYHFWIPIRYKHFLLHILLNFFYFRGIFLEFSDYFRLVAIYSILVTMMFVCLCLYGLPKFNNSDVFEIYEGYQFYINVVVIGFLTSLIVFITHAPFILIYR